MGSELEQIKRECQGYIIRSDFDKLSNKVKQIGIDSKANVPKDDQDRVSSTALNALEESLMDEMREISTRFDAYVSVQRVTPQELSQHKLEIKA